MGWPLWGRCRSWQVGCRPEPASLLLQPWLRLTPRRSRAPLLVREASDLLTLVRARMQRASACVRRRLAGQSRCWQNMFFSSSNSPSLGVPQGPAMEVVQQAMASSDTVACVRRERAVQTRRQGVQREGAGRAGQLDIHCLHTYSHDREKDTAAGRVTLQAQETRTATLRSGHDRAGNCITARQPTPMQKSTRASGTVSCRSKSREGLMHWS